ncbi:hypothetical protein Trydic_g406 [Trypoxylus dichotomus]
MDVKSAFLHGKVDEDIYMNVPDGSEDSVGRVCKPSKALYGLKQSPYCWNKRFDEFAEKERNSEIELVGFADVDWAGDQEDIKSTTGYLFKVYGGTICWSTKKQSTVAMSSTEAEYIALAEAARDVQEYAPTSQHSEEEVTEFYPQTGKMLKELLKQELGIVNVKIRERRVGDAVGPYGLGERNERGNLLSQFA